MPSGKEIVFNYVVEIPVFCNLVVNVDSKFPPLIMTKKVAK